MCVCVCVCLCVCVCVCVCVCLYSPAEYMQHNREHRDEARELLDTKHAAVWRRWQRQNLEDQRRVHGFTQQFRSRHTIRAKDEG